MNCHQHTESSDFIGSLRPVRGKQNYLNEVEGMVEEFVVLFESNSFFLSSLKDDYEKDNKSKLGYPSKQDLQKILKETKEQWRTLTDQNKSFNTKRDT